MIIKPSVVLTVTLLLGNIPPGLIDSYVHFSLNWKWKSEGGTGNNRNTFKYNTT